MVESYPYHKLPAGWESQVLDSIGAPQTVGNIHFLDAWDLREGTSADYNPFATTLREPGSTDLVGNSAHVQNYPDWSTGLIATRDTIQQTNFSDIWGQIVHGTIKKDQDVFSPNFNEWSGGGYDVVHTAIFKQLPSTQYTDAPPSSGTIPETIPDTTPSRTSIATWVVVGAIILIVLFVIR